MAKGFMYSKSIFKSRTFWTNLLGGIAEGVQVFAPILPVPPGTIGMVIAGVNIVLRRLTDEPVHVVTPR
jgi:hypothetical protein